MEDGDLEPIDPDLDACLRDIRVGKELGVSAIDVRYRTPLRWVGAALIGLEARRVVNERAAERASKRRKRG